MGKYNVANGNLITMALDGEFDVIGHCTNAMCLMGAGIAVSMKNIFKCDTYPLEDKSTRGDINKLGQIDWCSHKIENSFPTGDMVHKLLPGDGYLAVVNMYGQYNYGKNYLNGSDKPLDYEALALCMRKMNFQFSGLRIGLPYVIGCGLAGGDKNIVIDIIKKEFTDCDVTLVDFN